jgi:hypothetical protein
MKEVIIEELSELFAEKYKLEIDDNLSIPAIRKRLSKSTELRLRISQLKELLKDTDVNVAEIENKAIRSVYDKS